MLIDGDRLKVVNAPIARTKLGSATAQDVTNLQIALTAETAARIAADSAESAARIAADNALAAALATEVTDRSNADIALQAQITELQQPRYSTELLLAGM